jgi:hypothetical protein
LPFPPLQESAKGGGIGRVQLVAGCMEIEKNMRGLTYLLTS